MAKREGYRWFRGTWEPSAAERRVLDELAAGRTNAEIALRLGVSSETVKSHVARMLGEAGCADRQALVRWWQEQVQRRPLFVQLFGFAARTAAMLVAMALGGLLLVAGIQGVPRVISTLDLRPRLVSVDRPPDVNPLPTPMPVAMSLTRQPVDFIWQRDGEAQRMGMVGSVALDSAGNVYIAEAGGHTIRKYDPDGNQLAMWGGLGRGDGQFDFRTVTGSGMASALEVDAQGTVYVADGTGRIQLFDGDGRYLHTWPTTKGQQFGAIDTITGLAFDHTGRVYISDGRANAVLVFTTDGTPIARWGRLGTGPGEFQQPIGIAVDADGNIYVADRFNHRVQKLDPNGNVLITWGTAGGSDGEFNRPIGIAVDAEGDVYVADNYNHRVQQFDQVGRYLGQGGIYGTADGEFRYTGDVAVDAQGNLYVSDVLGGRLQKIRLR